MDLLPAVFLYLGILHHAELIGKGVNVGYDQVFLQAHLRSTALDHTVLRHMGHADLSDIGNGFIGNILSIEEDPSLQGPHVACDNGDQLTLPISLNTCNTYDLAFPYLHAYPGKLGDLKLVHVRKVLGLQHHFPCLHPGLIILKGDFPSHHQVGDILLGHILCKIRPLGDAAL